MVRNKLKKEELLFRFTIGKNNRLCLRNKKSAPVRALSYRGNYIMNFKQIVNHVVDNGNIYFQKGEDFTVLAYSASIIPVVMVEAWYRENRTEMILRYQEYSTNIEKIVRFYDSKSETSNFKQVKEIVDLINGSGVLDD